MQVRSITRNIIAPPPIAESDRAPESHARADWVAELVEDDGARDERVASKLAAMPITGDRGWPDA